MQSDMMLQHAIANIRDSKKKEYKPLTIDDRIEMCERLLEQADLDLMMADLGEKLRIVHYKIGLQREINHLLHLADDCEPEEFSYNDRMDGHG